MLNRQAISVLLFGAVLASAAVPQISHVFSARIKVRDDYPVEGNTLNWHYTVRAINRTKVMLEGILPSQYPGNMKMIYVAPKHYTLIQPFFDRTTCVTLPAVMPIVAFDVDSFAVFNGTYPCPNHPARMCDKWWSEEGYLKNSFFLFKDTAIPALLEQLIITSDGVIQNNDTFSFEWFSASTPDDHYFEIPSSLNCNDYSTKDNTSASAPRFALSRFGLGRAVPLESAKELVNDPANIARIASEVSTWTPAASSRFNGMTFADARKLTTWPSFKPRLPFASLGKPAQVRNAHLPASFDWRVQNPACVGGFDDQDYCGGCWAFGAVEAVADRICIQSRNNVSVPLSVQHMLSCTSGCYGCDGGYVDVAWRHLVDGGVPTASCIAFQGWQTDACPSQCDDGSDASENFVHLSSAYDVYDHHPAQNVKEIQKEIMRHGPVEAGFWAFDDFYNYKSGIYTRSASAKFAGGHAVKVLGWGEENGIPYWICANSWGASWGESGTFRIKRGVNECMIEQQVAAGMAAL